MQVLAWCWLAWAGANLALLLLAPLIIRPRGAYTNGIRIVVPRSVVRRLTADQLAAIVAHEQGHRARLHVWRNLAMTCCFVRRSRAMFERQEFEADDYAAQRVAPAALASALRVLSTAPFDLYRARRLESRSNNSASSAIGMAQSVRAPASAGS